MKYSINRLVIVYFSSQVNERKKTIFQISRQSVVLGMRELIMYATSTKGQVHTFKLLTYIQSESTLRWRNLKSQLSFYSYRSTAHTNTSKTGIACVTATSPGLWKLELQKRSILERRLDVYKEIVLKIELFECHDVTVIITCDFPDRTFFENKSKNDRCSMDRKHLMGHFRLKPLFSNSSGIVCMVVPG